MVVMWWWCGGGVVGRWWCGNGVIIIIIIKSLFIEGTGISKHKCVKSRLKTYMHQPTEHSSSAVGPSQIIK